MRPVEENRLCRLEPSAGAAVRDPGDGGVNRIGGWIV
jgi:hypothetical protein